MKKLLLIFLLASNLASAEWVRYGESDDRIMFGDLDNVFVKDNFRRVWTVTNKKQRALNGSLSERVFYEFDCDEQRIRGIHFSVWSEQWAKGENLAIKGMNDLPGKWRYIPPEAGAARSIFTLACAKK